MSGESESRIRELFAAASALAPALIFLDELDAVAPKRSDTGSGSRGMEKRMVAQLLTCMDAVHPSKNRNHAAVMVLASTNRPDSLDVALRCAGRFDVEISLGVPDEEGRASILRTMTKEMRMTQDIDFKLLAKKTPGFVGADLRSLAKEAAVLAINRIFRDVLTTSDAALPNESKGTGKDVPSTLASIPEGSESGLPVVEPDHESLAPCDLTPLTTEQLEPLYITMGDFLAAVPKVQPSGKREGFATIPDVSWDDIGALKSIREELTMSVLEPIRNPEKFIALGLSLPAGVLLYGVSAIRARLANELLLF
jgi:ribosome biogenesis ATPase